MATTTNSQKSVPKLYITAKTTSGSNFDQITLQHWREEGFDVTFIPFAKGGETYIDTLKGIGSSLNDGERFGVIGMLVDFIKFWELISGEMKY